MNWKEKLGIEEEVMEEENSYIFTKQIDEHFLSMGFYEHTMNPRFFDGIYYDKITENVPVLRFDGNWDWDGQGTQRVFMNKNEIYVERQTSYRSFDGSRYHKFETEPTSIEEIEEALGNVVEKYGEI